MSTSVFSLLHKKIYFRNSLFYERFNVLVRAIPNFLFDTIHPCMEAIEDCLDCIGYYTPDRNFSHSLFERSGLLTEVRQHNCHRPIFDLGPKPALLGVAQLTQVEHFSGLAQACLTGNNDQRQKRQKTLFPQHSHENQTPSTPSPSSIADDPTLSGSCAVAELQPMLFPLGVSRGARLWLTNQSPRSGKIRRRGI